MAQPQSTASNSAPQRMVQCGLQFYNKKTTQTAQHRIASSLYINIFIYLFLILNILLIV